MSTTPIPLPSFAPVTLTSTNMPGVNITVAAHVESKNPLVFVVTAVAGGTTYTERHTIGANGTGPALTAASLQTALNGYRQSAADAAAWQESIHALVGLLQ